MQVCSQSHRSLNWLSWPVVFAAMHSFEIPKYLDVTNVVEDLINSIFTVGSFLWLLLILSTPTSLASASYYAPPTKSLAKSTKPLSPHPPPPPPSGREYPSFHRSVLISMSKPGGLATMIT